MSKLKVTLLGFFFVPGPLLAGGVIGGGGTGLSSELDKAEPSLMDLEGLKDPLKLTWPGLFQEARASGETMRASDPHAAPATKPLTEK